MTLYTAEVNAAGPIYIEASDIESAERAYERLSMEQICSALFENGYLTLISISEVQANFVVVDTDS